MDVFSDFQAQRDARIERPVVTIGTFDGVHWGHRKVLEELHDHAAMLGGRPGVLTFRVHPRRVLTGQGPPWLTSLPYRLRLFQQAGIAFTTFIPFSRELSLLSPREFVQQFLVEQFRVAGVVMGYDSCFGHKGSGTPEMMAAFGREFGFVVTKVPKVQPAGVPTGGGSLSSSAIREFIAAGRLAEAAGLLGRPVTLLGTVIHDRGLGRTLGFPTANLAPETVLLPHRGVYATRVFIGPAVADAARLAPADGAPFEDAEIPAALGSFEGPFAAVTNIGVRPTVAGASAVKTLVESHLLDFDRDLYGRLLAVQFVAGLRPERKFAGLEALKAQIGADVAQARALLAQTPAGPAI
ncbi:MAG: bifunctional riboflavin kinase/FAD synthetase [Planctomycetota bacterium]